MLSTLFFFILFYMIFSHSTKKRQKAHGVKVEMIRAKIMLQSNNPKEIEKFLMDKEPYLAEEMINLLIDRIGELKNDQTIADNWDRRYARIAPENVIEEEALPEQQVMSK